MCAAPADNYSHGMLQEIPPGLEHKLLDSSPDTWDEEEEEEEGLICYIVLAATSLCHTSLPLSHIYP